LRRKKKARPTRMSASTAPPITPRIQGSSAALEDGVAVVERRAVAVGLAADAVVVLIDVAVVVTVVAVVGAFVVAVVGGLAAVQLAGRLEQRH
jgi:hypothetical protein